MPCGLARFLTPQCTFVFRSKDLDIGRFNPSYGEVLLTFRVATGLWLIDLPKMPELKDPRVAALTAISFKRMYVGQQHSYPLTPPTLHYHDAHEKKGMWTQQQFHSPTRHAKKGEERRWKRQRQQRQK